MSSFKLPLLTALAAAAFVASAPAHATPARVASLSGNVGFTDDTDVFAYPSVIGEQPTRAWLNYNGGFDGGFTRDGSLIWLGRDTVANDIAGLGPQPGFRLVYGKSLGASGIQGRVSQYFANNVPQFGLGGTWSRGGGGDDANNLGASFDLTILDRIDGDPKALIELAAQGRNLTSDRLLGYGAHLNMGLDEFAVGGELLVGPRMKSESFQAALQLGPAIDLAIDFEAEVIGIQAAIPLAGVAGEYGLREWLVLRGSLSGGLAVATNLDDLVGNMVWQGAYGGGMGVGLRHESAQFDLSINPAWALNGPQFLSGAGQPTFGTLSGRVDF